MERRHRRDAALAAGDQRGAAAVCEYQVFDEKRLIKADYAKADYAKAD
jgi:hypothetical protein